MRKKSEILEAFAERDRLDGHRSFFMVGIGGAGMSALALMLHTRGLRVRGTDSTPGPAIDDLRAHGIEVLIGHSGEGIQSGDAVILSDAIELESSPEVAAARRLGCDMFRRSQLLGWLLKGKKVIAVTGTHGKTTTTGMIGAGLLRAGVDPLIVVGAAVPEFGGPVVYGDGEYAVVEACEAYDSFHDLDPYVVVLTNLELDHVDFHGTYENLRDSVLRFVSRIPAEGALVYCKEDEGARDIAARFAGRKVGYTASRDTESSVPGRHNALNAAGAVAAGTAAGLNHEAVREGVRGFGGAERRLQVLREGPITVVDDYAHHPSEISASIQALRERYPERRLVVVYQPHLYSRTAPLIPEFAEALSAADRVVITDIYPAREAPMPGVSSARIAELITKPVDYVPSRHLLPRHVLHLATPGDLIVGMGAGNIQEFPPAFLQELDKTGQLNVAVVYGGDSSEREVSLHSGIAVQKALQNNGHDAFLVDITELLLSKGDLSRFTGPNRPDVAFLAVHGTHAEDGAIQGLFELLHIPYTGARTQSSAIAMDKQLTKQILESHGMPAPKGHVVKRKNEPEEPENGIGEAFAGGSVLPAPEEEGPGREVRAKRGGGEAADLVPPLVVKPNAQGSTVGLSFVETEDQLQPAIENAFQYGDEVLVEEWIKGIEVSVPVLGDRALPVVEIAPATGRYDFASKYLPGATEEIVPARIPQDVTDQVHRLALMAHRLLRCEGATRSDFMIRDGQPYFLEINTLPGLTGTSLLPNSARAAGISFEELVEWIVQDAVRRHAKAT